MCQNLDYYYQKGTKIMKGYANELLKEIKSNNLTEKDIIELQKTLNYVLEKSNNILDTEDSIKVENSTILEAFCQAKKIEGKSDKTLYNYRNEVSKLFEVTNKLYSSITTRDVRSYMSYRKEVNKLKQVSVQNMRQYLMSFFKWLTREGYISINPMDRIDVIKVEQKVIDTLTDEEQEIVRCACTCERDLAIIDLLSGSAMRVSELCALNKSDVNFTTKEIVVFGKGSKERTCFMTGKAKVHLQWYLESRIDDNEALFVTSKKPYNRLTKNGVEYILRNIAQASRISTKRLYPHLYRKTVASNMYKKGADPSTIQNILGHQSVNTTLSVYCKVDKDNIKHEHDKYIN